MHTPIIPTEAAHRDAAARSMAYQKLSSLFFYPAGTRPLGSLLQETTLALRENFALLPYAVADAADLIDGMEADLAKIENGPLALSDIFTALFDNCKGRAAVSLYEKEYGNGDAKVIWEETIRFYEHFGLDFDVRKTRDWPDHIGTELEFMHYLTYLEATSAEDDSGETYRHAQGDFLVRHLARWAPRFSAQLERMADNAPFGGFARLVVAFIDADREYLGRSSEPGPQWIPQRESQTGAAPGKWIPIVEASTLEKFTFQD